MNRRIIIWIFLFQIRTNIFIFPHYMQHVHSCWGLTAKLSMESSSLSSWLEIHLFYFLSFCKVVLTRLLEFKNRPVKKVTFEMKDIHLDIPLSNQNKYIYFYPLYATCSFLLRFDGLIKYGILQFSCMTSNSLVLFSILL